MIEINQEAITFFTKPWELEKPDSKYLVVEKVALTVAAILVIIVLGIIIPLITCWVIKLQNTQNTQTAPWENDEEELRGALGPPQTRQAEDGVEEDGVERLTVDMLKENLVGWRKTEDTYFIKFTLEGSKEVCKFHISLDRRSPNFALANKKIANLLCNKGIDSFKFVNPKLAKNEINGTNLDGKEVCVYINSREIHLAPNLMREINEELMKLGIESGKPSRGDVLAEGNNYCYLRNDYNVFSKYLTADNLMAAGFTALESAYISKGKLLGEVKAFPKVDDLTTFNMVGKVLKRNLVERFVKSFKGDCFGGVRGGLTGVSWLISGDSTSSNIVWRTDCYDSEKFSEDSIFYFEQFNNILYEAAACLVCEFKKRKISTDIRPGRILPAIYHSILAPLAETFLSENSKEDKIRDVQDFLEIHKNEIIEYIVSCGLRNRTKVQIESKEPILLGSCSDRIFTT